MDWYHRPLADHSVTLSLHMGTVHNHRGIRASGHFCRLLKINTAGSLHSTSLGHISYYVISIITIIIKLRYSNIMIARYSNATISNVVYPATTTCEVLQTYTRPHYIPTSSSCEFLNTDILCFKPPTATLALAESLRELPGRDILLTIMLLLSLHFEDAPPRCV